jgi:8-oxo-dGTP diphosphatase
VHALPKTSNVPAVVEDGATVQENARKKATEYARALGETVFSMDNGLYFDDLPLEEQPGVHVRRINRQAKEASDAEMFEYYGSLVTRHGGTMRGRWELAICVASPAGILREETILMPRIFTDKRSEIVTPGYPLEAMQIDEGTGKYMSEMTDDEKKGLWEHFVGEKLRELFRDIGNETTDFKGHK